MREEQPCLQFWVRDDGMDVFNHIEDRGKGTKTAYTQIAFTPEIDALLCQLQMAPIDCVVQESVARAPRAARVLKSTSSATR